MSNTAIILAAGNGTRMKADKSKLLLEINGMTVIERTVKTFSKISDIDDIIVVVRESDIPLYEKFFPVMIYHIVSAVQQGRKVFQMQLKPLILAI